MPCQAGSGGSEPGSQVPAQRPFPVALVLIEFKIRIKERFMTAEFPGEYPGSRTRVPRLVPSLRLVTGRRPPAR